MPDTSSTVGDLVAAFLDACGVRTAFGVISIHNMPVLDAFARGNRMRFVPARGEAGALNMADAFARVSGGLGVGVTSTGVAAGNAAGSLVEARTAGSPVLHLTGQIERGWLDRGWGYIHEAPDQPTMLKGVSKAFFRVGAPEETLDVLREAVRTAREMLGGAFGEAGRRVVIEEFMEGEELSVFCIADGEDYVTLLPSQDHKRIGEGDTGPNTGGMGAYAPVGFVTAALMAEVEDAVVAPVLRALGEAGCPFRGLLYAGLMITDEGPKVVEFNCRFGDPETQAVLPLLTSSLLEPMMAVAGGGGLAAHEPVFADAAAVTTVLAASGYPGAYGRGAPVSIPEMGDGVHVFHAGTALEDGRLVTCGGRVLAVTAVAPDFDSACEASRGAAETIAFKGRYFRRDIGWREEERRSS